MVSCGAGFIHDIIIIYIYKEGWFKKYALVMLFAMIMYMPWQYYNYVRFGELVLTTTSGGLNFYRGHNPYYTGFWCDDEIEQEILKLKGVENLELRLSEMYRGKAWEAMREDPAGELLNNVEKVVQLWSLAYYDKRSFRLEYLLPSALLFVLFYYGMLRGGKKNGTLILFYTYHTILVLVFFMIVRYQSMMKVMLVPVAAVGVELILEKMRRKRHECVNK